MGENAARYCTPVIYRIHIFTIVIKFLVCIFLIQSFRIHIVKFATLRVGVLYVMILK